MHCHITKNPKSRKWRRTWALEDDLLSADDGEPRASVVAAGGVAELGPVAALDGRLGEARAGELAEAGGGGDLDLLDGGGGRRHPRALPGGRLRLRGGGC